MRKAKARGKRKTKDWKEEDLNFLGNNKEELIECIKRLSSFNPSVFKSNTVNMNKMIIDYIESL